MIVGHRANTLPWIRRHVESGAQVVEIDVWYRDGRVGLGHILDEESSVTLREKIARFLLNLHFRRPPDPWDLPERLPGSVGVWLDLKTRIPPIIFEFFKPLLKDRLVAVSTRWHSDIPEIREHLPGARLFASLDHRPADPAGITLSTGADGLSLRVTYVDEDLVRDMHRESLEVAAWTVNDEGSIVKAIRAGVDYIITDTPRQVLRACRRADG